MINFIKRLNCFLKLKFTPPVKYERCYVWDLQKGDIVKRDPKEVYFPCRSSDDDTKLSKFYVLEPHGIDAMKMTDLFSLNKIIVVNSKIVLRCCFKTDKERFEEKKKQIQEEVERTDNILKAMNELGVDEMNDREYELYKQLDTLKDKKVKKKKKVRIIKEIKGRC